jgi:hypothetical protein
MGGLKLIWSKTGGMGDTKWQHLGPLYTRAKSHDHIIVRALKKVTKGHPKTPPKSCIVVTDCKYNVKSFVIGPSTKCYFNDFMFMHVLTYDKIKQRL